MKYIGNYFQISDTPLPHVGIFFITFGKFDQFFTPPPSQLPKVFYERPPIEKITQPFSIDR